MKGKYKEGNPDMKAAIVGFFTAVALAATPAAAFAWTNSVPEAQASLSQCPVAENCIRNVVEGSQTVVCAWREQPCVQAYTPTPSAAPAESPSGNADGVPGAVSSGTGNAVPAGRGYCGNGAFVDNDGDGICDNAVSGGQGYCGNGAYVDNDGDGVCDNWTNRTRPYDGRGQGGHHGQGQGQGRGHGCR